MKIYKEPTPMDDAISCIKNLLAGIGLLAVCVVLGMWRGGYFA